MPGRNMIPLQISDYQILPITFPPLQSYNISSIHYLYFRNHEPKISNPADERSLFLVNLPIDASSAHIKALFSTQLGLPAGRIENIIFEGLKDNRELAEEGDGGAMSATSPDKQKGKKRKRNVTTSSFMDLGGPDLPAVWDRELHRSGSTAVIRFVDRTSKDVVFKAVKRIRKEGRHIIWGEETTNKLPALGSARYLMHHKLRYPDQSQLLESINLYMDVYKSMEARDARERARQRQKPDEEGFITITRGGRIGPARQEEAQEKAAKQKEKQQGLVDFYRFQTREKRKEKAGELLKKFQEDKEKVRRMREKRGRFKPE